MALSPGTRLGPYEILAPVGAGGMGEVYRARDARLGRDVAIKVLPSTYAADPDRMRRFEQEARAAAALNHPNIVAIYDIGSHEGSPYIVSELLDGATLRERLSGGALPQRKAVEYALDVARGLAAAHGKGIAHRDLKPENLFVTRDGRIKILDFGLAKLTRPDALDAGRGKAADQGQSKAATIGLDTDPGMILGTVGYMAPEQVRGEPADHRADLFALGAILYEMLTAKRPFHRPTAVETMNAILKEDPPDFSTAPRPVSPALERIVSHCLEKDPGARFQSAQDVAFNLEALSGLSEPSGSIPRPGHKARRAFRPLPALALLVALLGAFAIGQYLHGGGASPPKYRQLTFRKGAVYNARFTPDGQSYVFTAAWQGSEYETYLGRFGSPESRNLSLPGSILLGVSASGEMAIGAGMRRPGRTGSQRGTLATVPLAGGAPREVLAGVAWADYSPDGSSLAIARDVEGTYRLEYPVGKVLFETKGWIAHLRVSPHGDKVAFLFHPTRGDDRGSVMVVDRARKATTVSPDWSSEGGLAWSPGGKEVWFTAGRGGNDRWLYAASLSGKVRLVASVPGGVTLLDIARDGRVLLRTEDQRADMVGLVAGEEKERDLTWLDFSIPIDISADGKTLLFTEQGSAAGDLYSTYVRDVDGSPAIRLGEGQGLALSPDVKGALVVLYTTPPHLAILPVGAGEAKTLPNPGFDRFTEAGTAWTPDGKNIVFGAGEPGKQARCYVQNVESGTVRPVTPEGFPEFLLSANGDSVYSGGPDGKPYSYPIRGGKATRLYAAGIEPQDRFLRFSSDKKSVFLYRQSDQITTTLYRLDGHTRRLTPVRELKPADMVGLINVPSVVVSADGRTVVFMARRSLSRLFLAEGLR